MHSDWAQDQAAELTRLRLQTKVGGGTKVRWKRLPSVVAGEILKANNYTIRFDPKWPRAKEIGIRDVWGWMAYHNPVGRDLEFMNAPDLIQRALSVGSNAKLLRLGFKSFRKWMDINTRACLFMVPFDKDKKGINIITVDPYFQASDTQNVKDVYLSLGTDQIKSRYKKWLEKLDSLGGRELVDNLKLQLVTLHEEEANKHRQPLFPFAEGFSPDLMEEAEVQTA